jgi:hypothetical protein
MESLLRRLATLRDGFLVVGVLLYGTGFSVWSYHAWKNNVGLLPALDAQYFIAGIVPLSVILFAYLVVKQSPKVIRPARAALGPGATGWLLLARRLIFSLILVGYVVFMVNLFVYSKGMISREMFDIFLAVSILPISIGLIFLPARILPIPTGSKVRRRLRNLVDKVEGFYSSLMLYYLLGAGAIVLVFLFLDNVYPKIPQEFGGVKPKSAILELKASELSPTMMARLCTRKDATLQVIQSAPVEVLFHDEERLIFRVAGRSGRRDTLEVPRSAVGLIAWRTD